MDDFLKYDARVLAQIVEGNEPAGYLDELIDRIRKIWASERRFYLTMRWQRN